MYSVARRFGLSTGELAELNGISGSTIFVGQRLRLRNGPKYTAANGYDGAPRKHQYRSEDDGNGNDGYASEERKAPPPSYDPRYEERSDEEGASRDGRPYRGAKSYAERPGYAERPAYAERQAYAERPSRDDRGERSSQGEQPSYQAYREARAYEERREQRYESAEQAPEERYQKRRDERSDYTRQEDEAPQTYRKPKGSYRTYSVRQDETLGDIAERHGLSRRELADYNDIPLSAALYPGQVIRLPKARDYGQGGRPERYEEGRNDGRRVPYSQNAPAAEQGGKPDRRLAKAEPAARMEPARAEPARQEPKPETRQAEPAQAPRTEPAAAPAASAAPVDAAPAPMPSVERSNRPILAAHSDVEPAKGEAKPGVPEGKDCEALLNNPVQRSAQTFREPVQGLIVTKFGARNDGSFNDGIDFAVPKGTPVKAAENGVVAYVGNELSGFGNLVLVRHADGYVTAYAHNDEVLVSRCETVKRGQIISKAGASGSVTQPQLHFELRKDSKAVDPEAFFSRS
jgi:murein DD-endopeptidase MepM/ murein hydrolase activator NlpD